MKRSRKANVWVAMVMAVMLTVIFVSAESPAASITNLGTVEVVPYYYFWSYGSSISADGTTVTGTLMDNDLAAYYYGFRWTAEEGMQVLNTAELGKAYDISADGTTIVGLSQTADSSLDYPFKWTAEGGMVDLGTLGGSKGIGNVAYGVSADGSVIVGQSKDADNQYRAFRWTSTGGMESLGTLSDGWSNMAYAVSSDGSVVVGESGGQAFRWTAESGMVALGTFGGSHSEAANISADGTTIVGFSYNADEENCLFRWTEEAGMVNLGVVNNTDRWTTNPLGVSADGSVIVGTTVECRAFIWTEATGILDLATVLEAQGVVEAEYWTLYSATDVTILPDGSCSIVGYGSEYGDITAFLINMEVPVPEPATLALLAAGGIALLRRNKKLEIRN